MIFPEYFSEHTPPYQTLAGKGARCLPASLFLAVLLSAAPVSAHPAWGIAVDGKGTIYFADIHHYDRGAVWKLTKEGEPHLLLRDFHAHNVSLDGNGLPVAAHGEGHHALVRIHPDGRLDTLFYSRDETEFFGGNCTYSPRGNIYFGIRNAVWKIGSDGRPIRMNTEDLEWNQALYVDPDENIYATEIGGGNGRVFRIMEDGSLKLLADSLISSLERPYDPHQDVLLGMTSDSAGNIYVGETAGQRIIRIAENHEPETFYRATDGWTPTAIDFHEGEAYIMEYRLDSRPVELRIVRVDRTGESTQLFVYDGEGPPEPAPSDSIGEVENTGGGGTFLWYSLLGLLVGIGVVVGMRKRKPHTGND